MRITGPRCVMAAAALAAIVGGARLAAQAQAPPGGAKPQIKQTHDSGAFVGIEGKDTYAAYCAVCHGASGKGNGPASPALKLPVPDLTTLGQRHGTFDAMTVEAIILGKDRMPAAHGDVAMPIWGPIFKAKAADSEPTAKLRARNLVEYLKSIQVK